MLLTAMEEYHITLKQVIEAALDDANLISTISGAGKHSDNVRIQRAKLGSYLYTITPKGMNIAFRDHLVQDASAMLLSFLRKQEKGDNAARPPTLPTLTAPTDEEIRTAMLEFTSQIEFPIKPAQQERIDKAIEHGETRVAKRMENIFKSWAQTKAASQMLRATEVPTPYPLFTDRSETGRGFLLARKGNNFYLLVRLFSEKSRYNRKNFILPEGFSDVRTGESLAGIKYPGLIMPLELGRDYHEAEFIQKGKPKSIKLLVRDQEFFVNMSFEFLPVAISTETYLGIDRGAAIIGAVTIIDRDRQVACQTALSGVPFAEEMRRYQDWIRLRQARGIRRHPRFKLRERRARIILGEFANRVIDLALQFRSQIVLENLDGRAFARFLKQSQVRKLYDILAYKCERAGLPLPVEVPAAFTSQTCPVCAHQARENRPKQDANGKGIQDLFCCVNCGYEANADMNASRIIALRGMHQLEVARENNERAKFQKFAVFRVWLEKSHQSGEAATVSLTDATTFTSRDTKRTTNEAA